MRINKKILKLIALILLTGLVVYCSLDKISLNKVTNVDKNLEKYFKLSDGTYKVGTDLDKGEYLLIANPSTFASYRVSTSSSDDYNFIVSDDRFGSNRYIAVSDEQYLTLQGCTLVKPNETHLEVNNVLTNGMFKVGVDIDPGEYNIKSENIDAFFQVEEIINDDRQTRIDGVFGSKLSKGEKNVTVLEGQYLTLSNEATLMLNENN